MKKSHIILVICICLLFAVTVASVSAEDNHNEAYDMNGVTVCFESDSQFNSDEQLRIADILINGNDEITPYGLSCFLFGHNYKTEIVTATKHKVNATAPRCLEEIYEVSVCSKCEDIQQTLLSSRYKNCCP